MRRAQRAGRLTCRRAGARVRRRRRPGVAAVDPAVGGRWGAPFSIPVMGIHAAMLPTGKVMWFSYPKNPSPRHGGQGVNDPNTAQAWLWNPATGNTKRVDPPLWRDPGDGQLKPANIWCAGQTFTADGRLVVFGGNLRFSEGTVDFKGLNKVYTFNPFNETWTEQPDMRHGRWYPTGVRMADGRIVIIYGLDESGAGFKREPDVELFTPSAGPQRARHGQPARHPRRRRPAAGRRALPAHVRDAVRPHAGGGTVPGGQLVPQPARRGEQLHLAGLPGQRPRPALGHRGAGARRDRRLDARDAAGRLGAAHHHLDHHRHRGADDRDLRRGEPLGRLAGRRRR